MKTYGGVVRGVVSRRFSSAFEQEEAMQDVWVHIYNHRASVDPDRAASFTGWLATVAGRRCIDLLRARGARHEDLSEEGLVPEVPVDAGQHQSVETRQL